MILCVFSMKQLAILQEFTVSKCFTALRCKERRLFKKKKKKSFKETVVYVVHDLLRFTQIFASSSFYDLIFLKSCLCGNESWSSVIHHIRLIHLT